MLTLLSLYTVVLLFNALSATLIKYSDAHQCLPRTSTPWTVIKYCTTED